MTRLGTRTTRSICLVLAAACALVLSGCGDGGGGNGGGGAAGGGGGGDEAAVEKVFRDYYENLADRDFEAACAKNAPETTDRMLENVRTANIEVSTCEEAFAAIYATGNAAELVDEVVRTTEVEDVTVAGETATITWSAETSGERVTLPSTMRRIDGEWKLVDVD